MLFDAACLSHNREDPKSTAASCRVSHCRFQYGTQNPRLFLALAFAAGAMIYVVVEELIPESQMHGNTDIATLGTMIGFSVMMVLDVALG